MIFQVYSIFDMKLGSYARPFFVQNDAVAMRAFGDEVQSSESQFGKHPEDYCLYRLCAFNMETGEFGDFEMRSIAKAVDFFAAMQEVK